jgi:pyruvate dehydrogenase E2 component (dihydrolipoamide acetyltransferase)
MPVSVVLPALGESVTEGTITRWLKKEGESVQADEPLLEVSTDKVDTEIPAPASGVLLAIKVNEDETVAVGAELAVIGEPGGTSTSAPESAAPAPQAAPAPPSAPPAEAPPAAPAPAPAPSAAQDTAEVPGTYVTPLVRKLAAEHGVQLSQIEGTGVGGRIRKQDVLEAAKAKQASPAAPAAASAAPEAARPASPAAASLRGRTEPMSRLRKVIAKRMVESLQTAAQLTTVLEADITNIVRLRERTKVQFEAREKVKLSFLPFFAKATVEALKVHPMLNADIDTEAGTITYHDTEHLGVAVDTERGLLVPVIHNAGDLSIAGLARKIADLAERTRSNKLGPDELSGGTFTLTNTGSRGALFDTPIINQPQMGILGTGAVVKRPVVISDPDLGDVVTVRSMVYLALTYDHRLVDGADAARFLTTIKKRLEEGRFEADLGL